MFLEVPWPGGSWEATVKYIVAILLIYLAALWLTLVFWTYRDIRQRSRDPFVQSCAVLLGAWQTPTPEPAPVLGKARALLVSAVRAWAGVRPGLIE